MLCTVWVTERDTVHGHCLKKKKKKEYKSDPWDLGRRNFPMNCALTEHF